MKRILEKQRRQRRLAALAASVPAEAPVRKPSKSRKGRK